VRSNRDWVPRVDQPPVVKAMTMRTKETMLNRRWLNLNAPRARAGVVDNSPPKDQHRAAAKAEHSAIYMVFFHWSRNNISVISRAPA
jgi:hypothetical protein